VADTGIQKLILLYKRLNSGGDYFEKQLKHIRIVAWRLGTVV
jgi:hypothetical protein